MKEQVCKYQRTIFETIRKIHFSTCGNHLCVHHCAPVSRMICDNCSLQEVPDTNDCQLQETLGDIYDVTELDTRTPPERQEILEHYCFKCKFLDPESKLCFAHGCPSHVPIDEYVKYSDFQCPLGLW